MTALRRKLRGIFIAAVALLGAFALSGCDLIDPPPPAPGIAVVSDDVRAARTKPTIPRQGTYRLRPGDTISVFVFDNPDLSRDVAVAPDGSLDYPLAGAFRAAGRTLAETRRLLEDRFSDSIIAPQVSVSLANIGAYTIYVNGEVLQPGAFTLQEPITLVQAIARAGGFTAFADREQILVYNPKVADGARRVFNYDQFVAYPLQQDILLKPGDTIIVQ